MAHSSATDMSTADTYAEVTLNLGSDGGRIPKGPDPCLLSTTTGGVEHSCHHCMLVFGLVTLLIGIASAGVGILNDYPFSTLSVLGLIILAVGVAMVTFGCLLSWYKRERKEKTAREQSFSMLVCETEEKKPTV